MPTIIYLFNTNIIHEYTAKRERKMTSSVHNDAIIKSASSLL